MPKKDSWNYRAFLRPATTDDGYMSAISANCTVNRYEDSDGKKRGNIESNLGFRDCTSDVSFCFYASYKRKHAMRELKAIRKIRETVVCLEEKYERAIAVMDYEDLW